MRFGLQHQTKRALPFARLRGTRDIRRIGVHLIIIAILLSQRRGPRPMGYYCWRKQGGFEDKGSRRHKRRRGGQARRRDRRRQGHRCSNCQGLQIHGGGIDGVGHLLQSLTGKMLWVEQNTIHFILAATEHLRLHLLKDSVRPYAKRHVRDNGRHAP